jgi:hypothetical protein
MRRVTKKISKQTWKIPEPTPAPIASASTLKRVEKKMLTPLVKRKSSQLSREGKFVFGLWMASRQVEFLPDGTPYKISGNGYLESSGASFANGLNKPFIVVSDSFTRRAERQNAAWHELIEWAHYKRGDGQTGPSHQLARKRINQRLINDWEKKKEREYKAWEKGFRKWQKEKKEASK